MVQFSKIKAESNSKEVTIVDFNIFKAVAQIHLLSPEQNPLTRVHKLFNILYFLKADFESFSLFVH